MELYKGLELPLQDVNGNNIKIGDRINITFGEDTRYTHENMEVYFNVKYMQVCLRGEKCPNSITPINHYANPEYQIL